MQALRMTRALLAVLLTPAVLTACGGDDDKPGDEMRQKVGTYAEAGFPNYVDADGDGLVTIDDLYAEADGALLTSLRAPEAAAMIGGRP